MEEPMANTRKSVREVTVMATPARRMVSPTVAGTAPERSPADRLS